MRRERERKSKIRNIGGETWKKREDKFVCACICISMCACAVTRATEMGNAREIERETTNGTILR